MDPFEAYSGSINQKLADQADRYRIPISGTFELLPFCNMRCEMCYIVHEKTEEYQKQMKSVDEWEKIIDDAIEEGMLYTLITGGEPLMYPGIKELLRRLSQKPIHLFLNTNATLMNREIAELLKQAGVRRVNVSLYGASNETYANMCKNPKGFDQVIRAFQLMKEYQIPFGVHTTLIPSNIHEYEDIQKVCNEFQVPLHMVYYMFPPYRKDNTLSQNNARFTPEEAAHVALRILKDELKGNDEALKMRLEANISCFEHPENYSLYGKDGVNCKGGVSNFWVDWRGQISGCGINNLEKVSLNESSFKVAWEKVSSSVAAQKMSDRCSHCRYRCLCPVCPASTYTETGSVGGTPEYLCEFAEIYAGLLIQEYERLRG